jgi:hypothetical protein
MPRRRSRNGLFWPWPHAASGGSEAWCCGCGAPAVLFWRSRSVGASFGVEDGSEPHGCNQPSPALRITSGNNSQGFPHFPTDDRILIPVCRDRRCIGNHLPPIRGLIDQALVRRIFRRFSPDFRECYVKVMRMRGRNKFYPRVESRYLWLHLEALALLTPLSLFSFRGILRRLQVGAMSDRGDDFKRNTGVC